jgi:maspardin
LTGIQDGPHEPFIADSVDFVVGQVVSRLTLMHVILNISKLIIDLDAILFFPSLSFCNIKLLRIR